MMIKSEKTRLLKEIGCKIGCEILLLSGSKASSQVGGVGLHKNISPTRRQENSWSVGIQECGRHKL